MKIETINNYHSDENTYIVYDEDTMNGIIIDPGCKIDDVRKVIHDKKINICYIFITHCHYDHILCLEELRKVTGAELVSGDNARKNIGSPRINLGNIYAKESEIVLKDDESISLDSIDITCIYTPGHTNCSVCYLIENDVFTGDTLFLRNVGRWDLPTGNELDLRNSIKNKLYILDDHVQVYPGHGESSSIGYEKKFNMYVTAMNE